MLGLFDLDGWLLSAVHEPPPDRQCRATVAGQAIRGTYWVPPHRCRNYAGPSGYCRHHQPSDQSIPEMQRDANLTAEGSPAGKGPSAP